MWDLLVARLEGESILSSCSSLRSFLNTTGDELSTDNVAPPEVSGRPMSVVEPLRVAGRPRPASCLVASPDLPVGVLAPREKTMLALLCSLPLSDDTEAAERKAGGRCG